MKKRSIVLFLTIIFVAAIGGVVMLYFSLSNSSLKRSKTDQFLVEANSFMLDFKSKIMPFVDKSLKAQIDNLLTDNNDSSAKTQIYNKFVYAFSLPLSSKYVKAKFSCAPRNQRLNINKLKDINASKRQAIEGHIKLFLANKYELVFPDSLFDLLHYALGINKEYSYLAQRDDLQIKHIKQGSIDGKNAFLAIINDYKNITKDNSISNVPWDEIISFDGKFLDYNHLKKPVCEMIFPYSSPISISLCDGKFKSMTKEDVFNSIYDDEKLIANELDLRFDFNPYLRCEISYESTFKLLLNFDYNQNATNQNALIDNLEFFIK